MNVKATFFLIKESLPLLRKGTDANVLVISSITGSSPKPHLGVYSTTKAALNNMVEWMAKELMEDNIRVNALSPGLIATEFSGVLWKDNKAVDPKKIGKPE